MAPPVSQRAPFTPTTFTVGDVGSGELQYIKETLGEEDPGFTLKPGGKVTIDDPYVAREAIAGQWEIARDSASGAFADPDPEYRKRARQRRDALKRLLDAIREEQENQHNNR